MAITEFSSGPERRQVGFVGDMPADAVEALKRRGHEPYQLRTSDLSQRFFLGRTCAVVLTQQVESPKGIYRELEAFAGALNHDCRIYVRWAPDGQAKEALLRSLNKLKLPPSGYNRREAKFFYGDWIDHDLPFVYAPFVHLVDPNASWDEFANTIVHNEAGPAPYDSLKIEASDTAGKPIDIGDEADLLIRRAFHNCERVCLFGKGNGLSGVGAYEGYAYLRDGELGGTWPYKFFVKLGGRVKVAREFYKYGTTLLENVPFHLGPRLRRERCVLGATHGLIVSDFVLGAETICESAREGRGVSAIANLFNVTLLPWRRAAKETPLPLGDYLLKEILSNEKGQPRAVPDHRAERLQAFGASATIADLLQVVRDMLPSTPVLTGMVHGDLHATNVLVRGNDAVVIDLERVSTDAPLLFDAANLEAGLFVDGFIKDRRSAKDILASLAPLYEVEAFEKDDHHCDPSNPSAWFMDSIRQIRMQAKQMECVKLQYAWMLGAVFVKKACNPDDFAAGVEGAHFVTFDEMPSNWMTAREAIRTLTYIVGERILLGLSSRESTGAPT
ncbi:phosphotransferase [Pelomonas sp. KK5]|uniref:phosphotransferase n=1 Tax=Pelomonas sp. KK5 TaxID=1855730 RepID=UPI00097C4C3F|nr:phosphotransferase [Pelomonas sp. KK5]